MKQEIAKLWVAALRSGQYKQGRGTLRNQFDQFCCLGVLCNEHAKAHPEIASKQFRKGSYLTRSDVLPYAVQHWAGMVSRAGAFRYLIGSGHNTPAGDLASINDGGASFAKIADIIEQYAELL